MNKIRITTLALAVTLLGLTACSKQQEAKVEKAAESAVADVKAKAEAAAKELEAREAAIDAYVYAYPLVTMEITRRVITNVEKPEGSKAPMGHWSRLRTYPSIRDWPRPAFFSWSITSTRGSRARNSLMISRVRSELAALNTIIASTKSGIVESVLPISFSSL